MENEAAQAGPADVVVDEILDDASAADTQPNEWT